jgi:hypothetical protein
MEPRIEGDRVQSDSYCSPIEGSGYKPRIHEMKDISKVNREADGRALQTVHVWLRT